MGWFDGVFAPVSLSMLSSVLFLRSGYILGNAGLLETFLQFGLAYVILVATVLSICAVATNCAIVEGGGVYFMISRTLGMEFGGAVGVLFWVGNVVSSALYLTACTEGFVGSVRKALNAADVEDEASLNAFASTKWINFGYASAFNIINLIVCVTGAKSFGGATVFIFLAVCIAGLLTEISFLVPSYMTKEFVFNSSAYCEFSNDTMSLNCTRTVNGTFTGLGDSSPEIVLANLKENLEPSYDFDCSDANAEVNFFVVFGVLFSGVTGIMSGANMSGDLVNAGKDIPRGTLSACLFTFLMFISEALLTAMTCNRALLLHDCMYLTDISFWPPIVTIGVLMAAFSASLNNLIGASRVLEAVAKDVLFGPLLSFVIKGSVKENPVTAVAFTWIFVEMFLLIGSLNTIAQLASVLFLLSYAAVNLSCLSLELASAPNFRPSFKYFSWHTSLFGLIGTTVMMFLISPIFSAVGILLLLSLVLALNFFSPVRNRNSGSISQALLFHQVRKYLLLLDPRKAHVKFWRPQILLLVSNPRTSCSLIDFVNALKKGGLYVLGHVYEEELKTLNHDPCVSQMNNWLSLVDHLQVKAFVELTLAKSLREGIQHLVRISGIGAMKPNTIILGYLDETFHGDDFLSPYSPFATERFEGVFPPLSSKADPNSRKFSKAEYVGVICDLLKMQKNVCLSRHFQQLNKCHLFRPERESIFGTWAKKPKRFLDVWLVDFIYGGNVAADTTSLFLLQLACIVNMVPRWKTFSIRVFVPAARESYGQESEANVARMLELLRIRAETRTLPWKGARSADEALKDAAYLKSASDAVRTLSGETAVAFLYLPKPPSDEMLHEKYFEAMTRITHHWPPTLLVRGVSPVTSITL